MTSHCSRSLTRLVCVCHAIHACIICLLVCNSFQTTLIHSICLCKACLITCIKHFSCYLFVNLLYSLQLCLADLYKTSFAGTLYSNWTTVQCKPMMHIIQTVCDSASGPSCHVSYCSQAEQVSPTPQDLGLDRSLPWNDKFHIKPNCYSADGFIPEPPSSYLEALKRQQRLLHGLERRKALRLHKVRGKGNE